MKLLMVFSYFTDGFAYAGEALAGRYIGAKDEPMLRQTVRWTFGWSMAVALIFMGIYHFAGVPVLKVMTSDAAVMEATLGYMPWLLLMPVMGCAAFTWDGIYIGATASKAIRNSMIWALVGFASVWLVGSAIEKAGDPYRSMHILMAAYFAHLLARTLYLTVRYRKFILFRIS
jgi:MATE family multidrug resistance protein